MSTETTQPETHAAPEPVEQERQLAVDDIEATQDPTGGNSCDDDCQSGYISAGGFSVCLGC